MFSTPIHMMIIENWISKPNLPSVPQPSLFNDQHYLMTVSTSNSKCQKQNSSCFSHAYTSQQNWMRKNYSRFLFLILCYQIIWPASIHLAAPNSTHSATLPSVSLPIWNYSSELVCYIPLKYLPPHQKLYLDSHPFFILLSPDQSNLGFSHCSPGIIEQQLNCHIVVFSSEPKFRTCIPSHSPTGIWELSWPNPRLPL